MVTMTKLVLLVALLMNPVSTVFGGKIGRKRGGTDASTSTGPFLNGNLGAIPSDALQHVGGAAASDESIVKNAAALALQSILGEHLTATGDEVVQPTDNNIPVDPFGKIHVRFRQFIRGHPVEGATMMVHIDSKDGSVFALNGEFSPSHAIDLHVNLTCNESVEIALGQSGIADVATGAPEWLTECEEAAVQGYDGLAHLAYKRLVGYQPSGDHPFQRTLVFASTMTGDLLALHPLTQSERSLETWDCKGTYLGEYCRVKSNSSNPMTSGHPAVVSAHNFAIATYDFYKTEYGRDSLDGKGLKLVSFANIGDVNNAAWDGNRMLYGGGDGVEFYPFSLALDVVAHELTHGLTQFTSNLVYADEPGAINEAMSDIFGAAIERTHLKKSINDTWLLAEDLFIKGGGAIRNMQDPAAFDNVDYYPDRALPIYWWIDVVHNNSGIANLAFTLMVQGGKHPRNKTNVIVPAINASDFDASLKAAARIFYLANTQCLSASSNFYSLRLCTLMFAGEYENSVSAAWNAVGVVERTFVQLDNGVELKGQNGAWNELKEYSFAGVKAGETVTCVTKATSGDADLYIRFGAPTDARFSSVFNDCISGSDGSNEKCTTGVTPRDTVAFVGVLAYEGFSDLSINCYRTVIANQTLLGLPITGQQGTAGSDKYYMMDLSHLYTLDDGVFKCVTYGTNGDANLFVNFGSLPSPLHDTTNDCESITAGSSKESCSANYTFNGVKSSNAFAAVHASTDFQDLAIQCNKFNYLESLDDGYAYFSIRLGEVAQFVMNGVKAGEAVKCTLTTQDFIEQPNGDADLYVRLGDKAEPYKWSTVNDCKGMGPTSNETCVTKAATKTTSAYVAVTSKKLASTSDYYYDIGGGWYIGLEGLELIVECKTVSQSKCVSKGATCEPQDECCSVGGKAYSCDGPQGGRSTCKVCKHSKKRCTRDSQCCSGKCQNSVCKGNKK